MKVLVVKMSSLGDVIHTLPALSDALAAQPGIRFDWVVEEAFAEIPGWHCAVDRVIPVAIRRWRRRPFSAGTRREWALARSVVGQGDYHAVIDAQGLLKSALVTRWATAPRYGMDSSSARERFAALAYDHRIRVSRDLHAVERTRLLFARTLGYPRPSARGSYGLLESPRLSGLPAGRRLPPGLLLCHGTARAEKLWPEDHWVALAQRATAAGLSLWLPWGNAAERQRAERIAAHCGSARVLPQLSLTELAGMLRQVSAAVAVDTGLGHLAAALDVPTVSLYGPTSTRLVGAYGRNQVHIRSPLADATTRDPAALMAAIEPDTVWQALQGLPLDAGAG